MISSLFALFDYSADKWFVEPNGSYTEPLMVYYMVSLTPRACMTLSMTTLGSYSFVMTH